MAYILQVLCRTISTPAIVFVRAVFYFFARRRAAAVLLFAKQKAQVLYEVKSPVLYFNVKKERERL